MLVFVNVDAFAEAWKLAQRALNFVHLGGVCGDMREIPYAFLASSSSALNFGDSARGRFDSGSSSEEDDNSSSAPLKDISSAARRKTSS